MAAPDPNPAAFTPRPLIVAEHVSKYFRAKKKLFQKPRFIHAVDDVSLVIHPGETLGLVGESGSGKSTLGRILLRLIEPTVGRISFDGLDISRLDDHDLRPFRRRMQIVFQDPYSSLNPRLTLEQIVGEGISVHRLTRDKRERRRRVIKLLERVGLAADFAERFPHELSGGQRQRVGIARALSVDPELVVCDEPTSALDVSVQAQIINLLLDLQDEHKLAYLFISHDLNVIERVSHRVAVMYLGKIVETAPTEALFQSSRHPYTRALLNAIPVPDPSKRRLRVLLEGDPPSPIDPPAGCAFHPRCPRMLPGRCDLETPLLTPMGDGGAHTAACFNPYP
jgi:oligopeptide transport system ATP-binding protein